MAHATDASTGTGHGRSTCLSVALLAPAADCRVSLPHLPSPSWCWNLAGAALRHLSTLPVQDDFSPPYGTGLRLVPSFAADYVAGRGAAPPCYASMEAMPSAGGLRLC